MHTKIVFAGDGGNSVDGTRNGSVMNPFIFLLFRVGLVAVGWFASSAETAPVLPSSLDVGKSIKLRKTIVIHPPHFCVPVELCFGMFLSSNTSATNNNTKDSIDE